MNQENKILLPGGRKQLAFLHELLPLEGKSILVIGAGCEIISQRLYKFSNVTVEMIVDDYESLLSAKLLLKNIPGVNLRLMEFDRTDFDEQSFDIVYVQGSISNENRNKIVKEIKRILKPGGYFCIGEIVSLTKNPPVFMTNIWESAGLNPMHNDSVEKYYSERKFEVINKKDLTATLKHLYTESINELQKLDLPDNEKSYFKKLIARIKHESNAYLKLGGDKHTGFIVYLLRKNES